MDVDPVGDPGRVLPVALDRLRQWAEFVRRPSIGHGSESVQVSVLPYLINEAPVAVAVAPERPKYSVPKSGGSFEHRSGDCETHGLNVPFARPYRLHQYPWMCVACMLGASK